MISIGLDGFTSSDAAAPILSELGKYKLLARIGRGGMGDIFLALAHGTSGFRKLVVLKCLRAESEQDETTRRMFLDEGRLAARLNHHHVVQTYEVGEADGLYYMAMEYLDGQPLSRIRRTTSPMDPFIAARIVSDALSGLHHAHELRDFDGTPLGIVHRDLSPPNIFVTYDGAVKLVDFGIAKTALASRAMTEIGILRGKLGYMAPEHITGGQVDRRADVYAMGVVLWELLTHRRLITEKAPAAAVKSVLHGTIPSPSTIRQGVDGDLDRIVARALARRTEARYSTALEMRVELEGYLGPSPRAVQEGDLALFMRQRFGDTRETKERLVRELIAVAEDDDEPTVVYAPRHLLSSGRESDSSIREAGQRVADVGTTPIFSREGSLRPHTTERRSERAARGSTKGATGVLLFGMAFAAGYLLTPAHDCAVESPMMGRATAASAANFVLEEPSCPTPLDTIAQGPSAPPLASFAPDDECTVDPAPRVPQAREPSP